MLALLLAGGFWALRQWLAHRRHQELGALAPQMGCTYAAHGPNNREFRQFEAFDRGDRRWGEGTMEGVLNVGERSHGLRAGDFAFTERAPLDTHDHTRRSERVKRFSYVLVTTTWDTAPPLRIRPEGFLDRVSAGFGFDDIDFESAEFSRAYHVGCADKKFAFDVITPRVMDALLRSPVRFDIQFYGGVFLVRSSGRRWPAERFREAALVLRSIIKAIPDHVIHDLEDDTPRLQMQFDET